MLYISFRKEFPTLNVKFLNEDLDFKSNEAKSKWREFISKYVYIYTFSPYLRSLHNLSHRRTCLPFTPLVSHPDFNVIRFENQVEDFNFGTLIRTRSDEDYGPENSFFVPRIQFVCVEVARNKEGANESVFSSRDFKSDDSSAETEQERLEREKEMARLEQKIAANLNYKQNGARN